MGGGGAEGPHAAHDPMRGDADYATNDRDLWPMLGLDPKAGAKAFDVQRGARCGLRIAHPDGEASCGRGIEGISRWLHDWANYLTFAREEACLRLVDAGRRGAAEAPRPVPLELPSLPVVSFQRAAGPPRPPSLPAEPEDAVG